MQFLVSPEIYLLHSPLLKCGAHNISTSDCMYLCDHCRVLSILVTDVHSGVTRMQKLMLLLHGSPFKRLAIAFFFF